MIFADQQLREDIKAQARVTAPQLIKLRRRGRSRFGDLRPFLTPRWATICGSRIVPGLEHDSARIEGRSFDHPRQPLRVHI